MRFIPAPMVVAINKKVKSWNEFSTEKKKIPENKAKSLPHHLQQISTLAAVCCPPLPLLLRACRVIAVCTRLKCVEFMHATGPGRINDQHQALKPHTLTHATHICKRITACCKDMHANMQMLSQATWCKLLNFSSFLLLFRLFSRELHWVSLIYDLFFRCYLSHRLSPLACVSNLQRIIATGSSASSCLLFSLLLLQVYVCKCACVLVCVRVCACGYLLAC